MILPILTIQVEPLSIITALENINEIGEHALSEVSNIAIDTLRVGAGEVRSVTPEIIFSWNKDFQPVFRFKLKSRWIPIADTNRT